MIGTDLLLSACYSHTDIKRSFVAQFADGDARMGRGEGKKNEKILE
jgi:hypothetical protein